MAFVVKNEHRQCRTPT